MGSTHIRDYGDGLQLRNLRSSLYAAQDRSCIIADKERTIESGRRIAMILSNDKNEQLKINEKVTVEDPFLDHLEGLGWNVIRLSQKQGPVESFRTGFDHWTFDNVNKAEPKLTSFKHLSN